MAVVENGNCAVLELAADNSIRRRAKTVAIEGEGTVEICVPKPSAG